MQLLDCTLRDGGYYNQWDFDKKLVNEYLEAMDAAGVQIVELGLRSNINKGFKGPNAFTTESYLKSLNIPQSLSVAVMVNASELLAADDMQQILAVLFPVDAANSVVDVVRVACHIHEFAEALSASKWLEQRGYRVGYNLMQIADRPNDEIESLAALANDYPLEVLYFADSMGSMDELRTVEIVNLIKKHWSKEIGIHTHDNMGKALANSLAAYENGVAWIDSTVTGMGRGPGNARTEEIIIEFESKINRAVNIVPVLSIIRTFFEPLKKKCGWGSNPFYFLTGKYSIHPTYVQEMLSDARYSEEDILSAINHLKTGKGKKFSFDILESLRNSYGDELSGDWTPSKVLKNKDVLLLGAGEGVVKHKEAIEAFIKKHDPIVIAINTQTSISSSLINYRVACHPIRLLADCEIHKKLEQSLIAPLKSLPLNVQNQLSGKEILDFGLTVKEGVFEFNQNSAYTPNALAVSYAFSIAASGGANSIKLAGFDGYSLDDKRYHEMNETIMLFRNASGSIPIESITNTSYELPQSSVYSLIG